MSTDKIFTELSMQVLCLVRKGDIRGFYRSKNRVKYGVPGIRKAGYEIAGIAGLIIGASAHRIPVVIDGFISSAAALVVVSLKKEISQYLFASHLSVEKGHLAILDRIGLNPLLDLNLRLGEGTGACLAINLIEAGVKILTEIATFEGAGVSEAEK